MDGDLRPLEGASNSRERLLRAGLASFAELGFEAAGTRLIAARAGVQQGLVRHHFGSKSGLFDAVLERAAGELDGDLAARQPLTVEGVLELLARHGALARLVAHALLARGEPAAAVQRRLSPWLEQVVALQRAAQGEVPDAELRAWMWLASAFVASVLGGPTSARAPGDALFAWLCARASSAAPGPFSTDAARARLRGEQARPTTPGKHAKLGKSGCF